MFKLVSSKNFKSLSQKLKNNILSVNKREGDDIMFIRHAESEFNQACDTYR